MRKITLLPEKWDDKLNTHWLGLPKSKQRTIILYSFLGYILITALVLFQTMRELGTAEAIETGQIQSPFKEIPRQTNNLKERK